MWDPIPRICDGEEVADCCEMAMGGEGCSAKGMVKANSGSSRLCFAAEAWPCPGWVCH